MVFLDQCFLSSLHYRHVSIALSRSTRKDHLLFIEHALNDRVLVVHTEVADGSFHPGRPDFADQLSKILYRTLGLPEAGPTFFPSLEVRSNVHHVTGQIVPDDRTIHRPLARDAKRFQHVHFWRSRERADGSTARWGIPQGYCPADSPYVVAIIQGSDGKERMGFAHIGRDCLVDPKRDNGSVIANLLQPGDTFVAAHIGRGIRPCCYRFPDPDTYSRWRVIQEHGGEAALFLGGGARGPHAEKPCGMDLHAIAFHQLMHAGLNANSITMNQECTACAVDKNGKRRFYSHTYGCGRQERNLVIAYPLL